MDVNHLHLPAVTDLKIINIRILYMDHVTAYKQSDWIATLATI